MSYMPAELHDDFEDYEDGFLGDEEALQTSFEQYQQGGAYDGKFSSNIPKVTSKLDQHQRVPVVNQNQNDYKLPGSSSRLKTQDSKFIRKSTNQSVKKTSKSWKPSSVTSPSVLSSLYTMSSSPNVLTEDDFKISVIKGNVNMVQKCLQQGISIDKVLQGGWTALMYACNRGKSQVVELLLREGADPSGHVDLYTPLMCACSTSATSTDRLACVKMVVGAGVDVDSKDRQHSTGLMLASRLGHLDTVNYLLEKGAKVNEQDSRGWTALTWSVQRGHKEVVLALLESGADCNIRHKDRLTVKDMAVHLPTDEMLALLEKRPVVSSDEGDMNSIGIDRVTHPDFSSHHSILGEGDGDARSTDLRYGELEIFLLGLDLPHLVQLFQKHLIDLFLLLDMTEQDLINAGVEQVGARKKILDASQAVHKRNWEVTSLKSVHFNKRICCSDAVAMIANVSKHIRYINSTVVYIREHLKHHPHSVLHATDRVSPTQLSRHVIDTSNNVQMLQTELSDLQKRLSQELKNFNINPPDLIPSQRSGSDMSPSWSGRQRIFVTCGCAAVVAAGCAYAWRNNVLADHLHMIIGYGWWRTL